MATTIDSNETSRAVEGVPSQARTEVIDGDVYFSAAAVLAAVR
jgi:hypothetical protein